MSNDAKISPLFNAVFDKGNEDDIKEAIVILDIPDDMTEEVYVHTLRRVEENVRSHYLKASHKIYKSFDLNASLFDEVSLPFFTAQVTPKTLEILVKEPYVAAIIPNQTVRMVDTFNSKLSTTATQEEKKVGFTWGLERLDIPTMWETTKGRGIKVGVIDTGVYGQHPALREQITEFAFIDPYRRVIHATPFDLGYHGTHVCGTIAGQVLNDVAIGIAPEAELYVASVNLGNPNTTLATIVKAINWLGENGVNIVNMSFGLPRYDPDLPELFNRQIARYDMLYVAAIGNDGYGHTSQPANLANILAVGAVELEANNLRTAYFSGGASFQSGKSISVSKPDIVAPGVNIFSSSPIVGGRYLDGTSMAAPHVTGVCALLMSAMKAKGMRLSVPQVIDTIKATALHPLGINYQPDNVSGNGMLRPVEALKALLE